MKISQVMYESQASNNMYTRNQSQLFHLKKLSSIKNRKNLHVENKNQYLNTYNSMKNISTKEMGK